MAARELKSKENEESAYEEESSKLIKHVTSQSYQSHQDDTDVKTHAGHYAMDNCIELFKLDYDIELIDNRRSKLCGHYPSQIILMGEKNKCSIKGPKGENLTLQEAKEQLQVVMKSAALSRCRSRFVTPVIYCNGQYICRSATVSGVKEQVLNKAVETAGIAAETIRDAAVETGNRVWKFGKDWVTYTSSLLWLGQDSAEDNKTEEPKEEEQGAKEKDSEGAGMSEDSGEIRPSQMPEKSKEKEPTKESDEIGYEDEDGYIVIPEDIEYETEIEDESKSWISFYAFLNDKIQKDKQLLRMLSVHHICDLMVETAKVKYGMIVSSSEKADEEQRYSDFQLISFPYPGCEFFADWKRNSRRSSNLHYNWKERRNNAKLELGEAAPILEPLGIDWSQYTEWDLGTITVNYLRAILKLISVGEHGLLVHCISGWDRTPLFVSLVRVSLWADGLIHQSLEPAEMMYLTLAYDWYLFGHQYATRKKHEEEILPFCFYMLPKIADPEFSIAPEAAAATTPVLSEKPPHRTPEKKTTPAESPSKPKVLTPSPGVNVSINSAEDDSPAEFPKKRTRDSSPADATPRKRRAGNVATKISDDMNTIGGSMFVELERLNISGKGSSDEKQRKENLEPEGEKSESKPKGSSPRPGGLQAETEDLETDFSFGTPPDLDKTLDESLLDLEFEKIDKKEVWETMSVRKKRLLSVSYAFRNAMARSEGVKLPTETEATSLIDYFVYRSSSGLRVPSKSCSNLINSLFSFGSYSQAAQLEADTAKEKESEVD